VFSFEVEANDRDLSPSYASCGSWGREDVKANVLLDLAHFW